MVKDGLPVKIMGLGVYLPPTVVTSSQLESRFGVRAGWIERVTGVRERRRATTESSAFMAAAAAREALAHSGVSCDAIDVIIGASAVPQQLIPCTAALVQRELGAPEGRSLCFDINATCISFLVALNTAAHMLAAQSVDTALVYSSEITSLSLNPDEWESASLFGDAAVAAILVRTPRDCDSCIRRTRIVTHSSGAELTELRGGGTFRHPNDPKTQPSDFLFHMDGPEVFKKTSALLADFLDDFMGGADLLRSEYSAVIPHQASRSGTELLTRRYGFRPEQAVLNLATRGNCIAASIPLALAEAVCSGRVIRGDRLLLLGAGAGLTIGAMDLIF
jgi:3-oxoacyl-[acyl-carrier-protein] synthase III